MDDDQTPGTLGGNGAGQTHQVNPVQIQKFLGGVDYPADKNELIQAATQHGAPDDVLATLKNLPDQIFDTPADISQAIGKME